MCLIFENNNKQVVSVSARFIHDQSLSRDLTNHVITIHYDYHRFAELDTPSPDKYNNRGGSLLQSQKEAAKISKELPKIESKVLAEMDKTIGEVSSVII